MKCTCSVCQRATVIGEPASAAVGMFEDDAIRFLLEHGERAHVAWRDSLEVSLSEQPQVGDIFLMIVEGKVSASIVVVKKKKPIDRRMLFVDQICGVD